MKNSLYLFALIMSLLPGFHACAQTPVKDSADIAVSEGVLKLADWAKFDYRNQLDKAKTGDLEAVKALIDFHSVADGVDGINHGVTCLELIPVIGDETFASAIPVFKPKLKKLLLERLMLAQARTKKEALRQSLTNWAPASWAVLNDQPLPESPEKELKKRESVKASEAKAKATSIGAEEIKSDAKAPGSAPQGGGEIRN